MKNLFGVLKDGSSNVEPFIVRSASEEFEKEREELIGESKVLVKKKSIPQFYVVATCFLFLIGIGLCTNWVRDDNISFKEYITGKNKYLFFTGVLFIIIAAIIFFYLQYKNKKLSQDSEIKMFYDKVDDHIKRNNEKLNIPSSSRSIDVLIELFVIDKEGNQKRKNISLMGISADNHDVSLFVEDHNLCFSDGLDVVSIPLDSITGYEKISKKCIVPNWNKNELFNSPTYKPYKVVKYQQIDAFIIKETYKFKLNINGEEYYFIVPNYDFDSVIALLKDNGITLDK